MAFDLTDYEASLQTKLDATTGSTTATDLMLLAKAVEASTPSVIVSDVIAEGTTQVNLVSAEGAAQLALVEDAVDDAIAGAGLTAFSATVLAPVIAGATGKSTPVDADEFALIDSAASDGLKALTWANLKATMKAYTDTLYSTFSIAQNSKSAAYTTVLADAGKHILHPSADTTARIFTIDSNANVAYPVGTTLTFVNQNAGGVITIAITSDTMRLAGAGTTGNRTLAANGIATALKLTSTEWIISGTGLS